MYDMEAITMIVNKDDLKRFICLDSKNYQPYLKMHRYWHQLHTSPISDQWYIWQYIKTMRYCEYHLNNDGILHKLLSKWYLSKLRKISRITGLQIPPNTIGAGLTIWHWGAIIVNPETKIGSNCTLNPMIIIGHKIPGEGAPKIGDNVFIGGGAKIIGSINIGNNVTIAPNAVVVKDIPDNCVVGGVPSIILRHV